MSWSEIQECILSEIYLYLNLCDRYHASLACRSWNDCFNSPHIWTHCELKFLEPRHSQLVNLVQNYGSHIKTLVMQVKQEDAENRSNACRALFELARSPRRRLERLRIQFLGPNPMMYQGQEFIDALSALFGSKSTAQLPRITDQNSEFVHDEHDHKERNEETVNGNENQNDNDTSNESFGHSKRAKLDDNVDQVNAEEADDCVGCDAELEFGHLDNLEDVKFVGKLKHVDLSGVKVALDGQILCILAENNPDLESLDIQNGVYLSKIHPGHMEKVVQHCRKLKSLRLYSCTISEEVLLMFTEDNRASLEHLSIYHRRENKVIDDISSDYWSKVISKLPHLKVTLGFDDTCPLYKVSEVMKPEIPVNILRLETYTDLWNEILIASSYYRHSLEKLIVNSPKTKNCRELDLALLELTKTCTRLKALHVFCVLDQETVTTILERFPNMEKRGSYTLKYTEELHPWKPGNDYWP